MLLLNSDSGQNNGKMDLNLCASDWMRLQKFQIPNGRLLSQLSDGLSNGPKRLAICDLRISETRSVTESGFLDMIDLSV
jgi:hypothetical protein